MSHKDYKKLILEKLLGKYHSRLAKGMSTGRRIILKPTEVYKSYTENNADIEEKHRFNEAVEVLLQMKVVTADYLKFSADIEKIYLCEDKIDVIYGYIKDEYGIIPQSTMLKQVKQMLAEYSDDGVLTRSYCGRVFSQAEDPRAQIDILKIEANLKMLHFLEKNAEELYVREASMLVYGDSKWFENNNYDEICNLIREMAGMPKEEDERNDAILSHYNILLAEQEILLKGNWKIEWNDYSLDVAKVQGGIAISSGAIASIQKIIINCPGVMTIENKTSYQRMKDKNIAAMYLGGYANRQQTQFLRKVIQDNPDMAYYHFGDIDVGGFLIHRHLCRVTAHDFRLYGMGIGQLQDERYESCLKELTDNDRSRMESLIKEEPYQEVLKYMQEHNVKLEQEIVSYYLNRE